MGVRVKTHTKLGFRKSRLHPVLFESDRVHVPSSRYVPVNGYQSRLVRVSGYGVGRKGCL